MPQPKPAHRVVTGTGAAAERSPVPPSDVCLERDGPESAPWCGSARDDPRQGVNDKTGRASPAVESQRQTDGLFLWQADDAENVGLGAKGFPVNQPPSRAIHQGPGSLPLRAHAQVVKCLRRLEHLVSCPGASQEPLRLRAPPRFFASLRSRYTQPCPLVSTACFSRSGLPMRTPLICRVVLDCPPPLHGRP